MKEKKPSLLERIKFKNKRKKILIGVGIFLLVVIIVVAIVLLTNKEVEVSPVEKDTDTEEVLSALQYTENNDCVSYFSDIDGLSYEDIIDSEYADTLYLYNEDEEYEYYLVCYTDVTYTNEESSTDLYEAISNEIITIDEADELITNANLLNIQTTIIEESDETTADDEDVEETESSTNETTTSSSSNNSSSSSSSSSNSSSSNKSSSSSSSSSSSNSSSSNSSSTSSNSSSSSSDTTTSSSDSSSSGTAGTDVSCLEDGTCDYVVIGDGCDEWTVASTSDFSSKEEADNWTYGVTTNYWRDAYYMVGYNTSKSSSTCTVTYKGYVKTSQVDCSNGDGTYTTLQKYLTLDVDIFSKPSLTAYEYINQYCITNGYEGRYTSY